MEETETLPSFTLPSTAMCEWQSMIPGITYWPAASITCASFGALTEVPTSAILPSLIRMEPCSMVPCETVRMVAFWIRITGGASGELAARDMRGSANRHRTQAIAILEHILETMDGILTVHPRRQMNLCSFERYWWNLPLCQLAPLA